MLATATSIDMLSTQLQETGEAYVHYPLDRNADVRDTIRAVEAAAGQIGARVHIARAGLALHVTVVAS